MGRDKACLVSTSQLTNQQIEDITVIWISQHILNRDCFPTGIPKLILNSSTLLCIFLGITAKAFINSDEIATIGFFKVVIVFIPRYFF